MKYNVELPTERLHFEVENAEFAHFERSLRRMCQQDATGGRRCLWIDIDRHNVGRTELPGRNSIQTGAAPGIKESFANQRFSAEQPKKAIFRLGNPIFINQASIARPVPPEGKMGRESLREA
jgi:hypothetical protein